VFHGGCGDHAVRAVEGRATKLALTVQQTPAIRDGMCDGQDPVAEPKQQICVKPSLKLGAAATQRKHNKSLADFSDGDSAKKEMRPVGP
jgi:hypothetical protein